MKKKPIGYDMKLSKHNIEQWKKEVADVGEPTLGRGIADALSNDELLKDYTGVTPREYIAENLSYADCW